MNALAAAAHLAARAGASATAFLVGRARGPDRESRSPEAGEQQHTPYWLHRIGDAAEQLEHLERRQVVLPGKSLKVNSFCWSDMGLLEAEHGRVVGDGVEL